MGAPAGGKSLFRFRSAGAVGGKRSLKPRTKEGARERFVMPMTRFPVSVHRAFKREAAHRGRSFNNDVVTTMTQAVSKRQKPAKAG